MCKVPELYSLRSSSNQDGGVEEMSIKKGIYFIYDSRVTLKSLSLFLFLKIIANLNMKHNVKFETNYKSYPVVGHVLHATQNLVI